ncbi:MAG: DUF6377 domain-containing protein, partial [Prolixibacteraceae bacterium]|nr:DUF6377 domain-containing protein [Prolixibacteraceae bacterium]
IKGFVLFLLMIISSLGFSNSIDSLLLILDNSIQRSSEFQQNREGRIKSYKSLLEDEDIENKQKYLIYSKLYNEYHAYRFDSALYYLSIKTELARNINQNGWINESLIDEVKLLSATGMYKEASDVFSQIKRSEITLNQLPKYYIVVSNLYSQLAFYTSISLNIPHYRELVKCYRDSALAILPEESIAHLEQLELKYYNERQLDISIKLAEELLSKTEQNNPNYALFAYRLACNYGDKNNLEKEKEYLIRSAIADIKNGIKDNASLTLLAMMLYREEHIEKAYDYIKFSLSDASFFNAPLRFIELSNVLPMINDAYHLKQEKQKGILQNYLLLISFLAVFLITSLVFIVKQFRNLAIIRTDLQNANQQLNDLNNELQISNTQLNGLNLQLSESNHIKEQYIGHFLNRCSNYIEKIKNYQKYVYKQISLRKFAELLDSTKSSKLIDAELSEFYETFDQTFLILFPNFVEQINELFHVDERIILRNGELLNTELRIFALIRLGISDSSKIASLLRYSVNTIYNYRVKIKNKSLVPREEFEDKVKQIGNFNKNN